MLLIAGGLQLRQDKALHVDLRELRRDLRPRAPRARARLAGQVYRGPSERGLLEIMRKWCRTRPTSWEHSGAQLCWALGESRSKMSAPPSRHQSSWAARGVTREPGVKREHRPKIPNKGPKPALSLERRFWHPRSDIRAPNRACPQIEGAQGSSEPARAEPTRAPARHEMHQERAESLTPEPVAHVSVRIGSLPGGGSSIGSLSIYNVDDAGSSMAAPKFHQPDFGPKKVLKARLRTMFRLWPWGRLSRAPRDPPVGMGHTPRPTSEPEKRKMGQLRAWSAHFRAKAWWTTPIVDIL